MGSLFYQFILDKILTSKTYRSIPKRIILSCVILCLAWTSAVLAQTTTYAPSPTNTTPQNWILEGTANEIEGLGVADYSKFNPEKSWKEALQNAVSDLNANHSLIVSHYGYRIGRGPLRIRSDYAMRTFLDTTQVTVLDSARWKGRAFIRIKPRTAVHDSILYPTEKFQPIDQSPADTTKFSGGKWLMSTGSTPRIDSNWYMSVTKAKQDALRKLAEDLSVKVSSETYQKGETSRRYYNFSTMFSFQRIRVLKRIFNPDSIKVQVAVNPDEVKMLMD